MHVCEYYVKTTMIVTAVIARYASRGQIAIVSSILRYTGKSEDVREEKGKLDNTMDKE